jgi:hypothetical protein
MVLLYDYKVSNVEQNQNRSVYMPHLGHRVIDIKQI